MGNFYFFSKIIVFATLLPFLRRRVGGKIPILIGYLVVYFQIVPRKGGREACQCMKLCSLFFFNFFLISSFRFSDAKKGGKEKREKGNNKKRKKKNRIRSTSILSLLLPPARTRGGNHSLSDRTTTDTLWQL